MSEKKKYRKYFERDRNVKIRITDRDKKIIHLIYEHRFLSSEQIRAIVGGSHKGLLLRLSKLFHSGYLDRPKAQLQKLENKPLVYGIGNEGARLLSEELDLELSTIDWTSKNREVKGLFIDHTLMVAEFILTVRRACEKLDGVEFISPQEIINRRPVALVGRNQGLGWGLEVGRDFPGVKKKFKFSIIPDSAFGLRFSESHKKKKISFFFVEADRSTMPIRRNSLARSSYYKKMVGYFESWRQKLYSKNFGFADPRLLSLTISKDRIFSMVKTGKDIDPRGKGFRMFLFAPAKTFSLDKPGMVFDEKWLNGCNEIVSLLD